MKHGKRVLFEGAQRTMLDIDHGTYPVVDVIRERRVGRGVDEAQACRPPRLARDHRCCQRLTSTHGLGSISVGKIRARRRGELLRREGKSLVR